MKFVLAEPFCLSTSLQDLLFETKKSLCGKLPPSEVMLYKIYKFLQLEGGLLEIDWMDCKSASDKVQNVVPILEFQCLCCLAWYLHVVVFWSRDLGAVVLYLPLFIFLSS